MKERQFKKLMAIRKKHDVLVLRDDGKEQTISTFDLVVGDILLLKQGDSVPADCLLIEGDELQADESNITGESAHIKKEPFNGNGNGNNKVVPCPFLIGDSMLVMGKGTAVVCCVGANTYTGEVEQKLFEDDTEGTPLQHKLERVANFIGKIGMYVAIATLIALTLNIVLSRVLTNQKVASSDTANGIMNAIILSITIVVVAVPEGLPLAVTISLAYSVG